MIPLFPLKLAVLPKETIPLHIFEDRYKKLISECLNNNAPFGMIYRNDGQFSNTGCSVYISKIINKYDNGRYDILIKGDKRFEVIDFIKKDELWYGNIKFINEKYEFMDKDIFSKILDKYLKVLLSFDINYNLQYEMQKSKSFDFTKDVVIPIELKQEF